MKLPQYPCRAVPQGTAWAGTRTAKGGKRPWKFVEAAVCAFCIACLTQVLLPSFSFLYTLA